MILSVEDAKRRLLLPELFKVLNVPGTVPERDGVTFSCPFADRHKRGDRNPSFNFFGGLTRYRCFGCGATGDGPDFCSEWLGVAPAVGLRKFIALTEGAAGSFSYHRPPPPTATPASAVDEYGDCEEKRAKRRSWPTFEDAKPGELERLARLRGFSLDWLDQLQRGGDLRFCWWSGHRAWVLRSGCRRLASARRVDGCSWDAAGGRKAWNLPGSLAKLPLGLERVHATTRVVAIAEGGPDWISVRQMASEERRADCVVLGLLGATLEFTRSLLARLRTRRVRIFAHNDEAGRRAAAEWCEQLNEVGCVVDAFDFAPFGVKDANDFLRLPKEQRDVEVMPDAV